jgi:predicted transcriptional regulator of viral defense system
LPDPILAKDYAKRYFLHAMDQVVGRAAQFVAGLAASGRHHFTTDDAVRATGGSIAAVRASLRRLKAKRQIADPHRGFHVIVPPEYRRLGCLPADQFVPQLMEHIGQVYYVALLSAAELHGAAHQRPQGFQVMVKVARRRIVCGEVRVQFVARKDLDRTPVVEKNTQRGRLRVASPEATALELVGYADRCGGLDNVASVVAELVESLDADKLVVTARACPVAWAQRLGYLLDLSGRREIAEALVPLVKEHARVVAPLVRARPRAGAERVARWKLAVNASVEPDL